MASSQAKRVRWRYLGGTIIILAIIGVAATFHWRAFDLALAFAFLALLVIGSPVVLWHAWQHRHEPLDARLGQIAALPPSWRKFVLGESDDEPKK